MTTFGPWPGVVLSVHDGDTLTAAIDLGFNLSIRTNCRIKGINAPELNTAEGKEARAYALSLVGVGDKIAVLSHGWDKYGGRIDATITLTDGSDFATEMLVSGHAVVYNGGPR